ncbi:hypothetical protein Tco_1368947 [Tanacetum coccineum]
MYFLRDASLLTVKRFPRRSPTVDQVCTFTHPSFQMAKSVAKYSIMTQEMVDSFCEAFYIPVGVHPTAPRRDKTIIQFPTDMGDVAGEHQRLFYASGHSRRWGSSSTAAAEVPVPTEERQEDVAPEDAYQNLADPNEDAIAVRQGEERIVSEQPKKVKRRRLVKQSDALPAKKLRTDHPSLASEGEGFVDLSAQGSFQIIATAKSSGTLSAPVDTAAAATTSTRPATASKAVTDVGPSYLEESESSDDSFYEIPNVDPAMAKRCCWKRDLEILELKSKLAEKETEGAEAIRLRDQVSSLSGEKSALTAEVSALKVTIAQKDHDISLLDSHATSSASGLEDAKVACTKAGDKIISLTSERDRLISKVSSLHAGFQDFKKKMEVQQKEQAQELYNRVAELEAYVMDVSSRLEGEFYPTYLTTLAGRRWLLAHGAGLKAGHEHGSTGRSLSVVDAYNPEDAKANYIDAVKALEDVDFPLMNLLKSKKDAGMDEVLDCFLLDEPAAELPKAMHVQPCLEQLTVPIHHAGDKSIVGETSLSFALMNVDSPELTPQTCKQIQTCINTQQEGSESRETKKTGSLALLKYLKSSEYQGIPGYAFGRTVDFGMQAGLEAGHKHGSVGRSLSMVDAYNPEAAKANYIDAVKALEDVDFPFENQLKLRRKR